MSEEREEREIWGYWDCPYCKTKHIRGDNEVCTSCGSTRSAETEFYLDDDISDDYVTDEEKETMNLTDEENWICSYCNAQNVATESICHFCGASREEKSGDYFEEHNKAQQRAEENNQIVQEITQEQTSSNQKQTPEWLKWVIRIALIILVIFSSTMAIKFLTEPIPKTATVTSINWQRSIQIQKLVTEKDSGWSLPDGAELQDTKREIKDYKKVIDHYENKTVTKYRTKYKKEKYTTTKRKNMGNGRYKSVKETKTRNVPYQEAYKETVKEPVYRKEPVYATKYYYLIDRWKDTRSIDTNGDTKEVYWGPVSLESKEREGQRKENYTVTVITSDNEEFTVSVSYELWKQCEKDTVLHYTETRLGEKSDLSL